mmetsp:Transcript_17547/g.44750  ORF Transcript_17547/g.44750 Transcript_17547/m.44750 type:complete len:200 (+) Transcript_17547:158-757(+)
MLSCSANHLTPSDTCSDTGCLFFFLLGILITTTPSSRCARSRRRWARAACDRPRSQSRGFSGSEGRTSARAPGPCTKSLARGGGTTAVRGWVRGRYFSVGSSVSTGGSSGVVGSGKVGIGPSAAIGDFPASSSSSLSLSSSTANSVEGPVPSAAATCCSTNRQDSRKAPHASSGDISAPPPCAAQASTQASCTPSPPSG